MHSAASWYYPRAEFILLNFIGNTKLRSQRLLCRVFRYNSL